MASGFQHALGRLEPLTHAKTKKLFVSTVTDWTAFFQNGISGSDPTPAMHVLSRRLGVRSLRVCSTPGDDTLPAHLLEVYDPVDASGTEVLSNRRTLGTHYDGSRWTFLDSGEAFAFEKVDRYRARRIRDRFGPAELRGLLAGLGFRIWTTLSS